MGQPKKKTSSRRTGQRRSHINANLARTVNRLSPVKVYRPQQQRRAHREQRSLLLADEPRPPIDQRRAKESAKAATKTETTAKTAEKPKK